MLAPDGRCKTLDAAADGYTRAEAAVLVMLQEASAGGAGASAGQAMALLLAGTAVNQDGRSSSLTAPHGPSQQAVVVAAAGAAALGPAEFGAVEMHGTGGEGQAGREQRVLFDKVGRFAATASKLQDKLLSSNLPAALQANCRSAWPAFFCLAGTALGDPIEVGALAAIIKRPPGTGAPATELAAAKSCFGHAETAAGLVGVSRAVARLQGLARSPVLHLISLNSYVSGVLEDSSSCGSSFAASWQAAPGLLPSSGSLHAGCSAFAFQGTNAHAALSSQLAPAGQQARAQAGGDAAWQRRRYWYQTAPHHLLSAVAVGAGSLSFSAAFEVALGRPALAFLWEHQVSWLCCSGQACMLCRLSCACGS